MKRVLVITGGHVSNKLLKRSLSELNPSALIAADRGMMAVKEAGVTPDYLVGDFDSTEEEVLSFFRSRFEEEGKPVIRAFCPEKDETDTELALSTALGLLPDEIYLLGATGTRLDHTMANIGLLYGLLAKGVKGYILDEFNRISLHDEVFSMKKEKAYGPYFSILPFGERLTGLTITGAKYNVEAIELREGTSLGISNEFKNKTVKISFKEGVLVLFETSDEPVV